MIGLGAALLLVAAARATTVDPVESLRPTIFPRGRDVPRNARLLVLESWPPRQVRLVDEEGHRVPARVRRADVDLPVLELRPRRPLEADQGYCIEIAGATRRSVLARTCLHTAAGVDVAPPVGAMPEELTLLGNELRLRLAPGVDASDVVLELEVQRPGAPPCRDVATSLRRGFQLGGEVSLDGMGAGSGTHCFSVRDGPDTDLSLRVRWLDAAGNVGPWSPAWSPRAASSPAPSSPAPSPPAPSPAPSSPAP